jgi:hypothetical protein
VQASTAGLLSGTGAACGGAVSSVTNSDGTLTISPTTGAVVASFNYSHAGTFLAAQTFTNSDVRLLGSSTGYTTFTSANAGASNFTLTFPATTDTLMTLGAAQTVTGVITFSSGFTSNGNININNAVAVAFTSRTNASITSPATSQLQFGGADGTGANPITLSMVGVAAGNSNTASPNGTILGGLATGTPAGSSTAYGGDLIFKTTNVGAAATSRNTSSNALTLKGGTQLIVFNASYTVGTLPTGITGARTFVTDQLTTCAGIGVAPTGGGAVFCPVFYNGSAWVGG